MTPRVNACGQPIGAALSHWTPRDAPTRRAMIGRTCRLEPLDPDRHGAALHSAYEEASDDSDWTYLPHERERDVDRFCGFLAERAALDDPLHMVVLCEGVPLGTAAFMRIDRNNGAIEIGHVHFAPRLQRTVAATEAIVLMMARAFDDLGYRRLEWKCDALNAPSRRAAERLGLRFEGLFRNAIVTKGRNRDTSWYAATREDWPQLALAYRQWLAPENFDAHGRQMHDLATIRG